MAETDGHDVHFESADAGASLTYPQAAGTVRKNGFLVIKGRPCKVCILRIGLDKISINYAFQTRRSDSLNVSEAGL